MKIIQLISLFLIIVFSSDQITAQSERTQKSEVLHQLFDEVTAYERLLNTSGSLSRGKHPDKVKYSTLAGYEGRLSYYEAFAAKLNDIDKSRLSKPDLVSAETMALKLSGEINQLSHKMYLIPFNAEGGFFNSLSTPIKRLPFKTEADYMAYAKWLPTYKGYLNAHRGLMKEGMRTGVMAPKIVVGNVIKLLTPWANPDPETHVLCSMLKKRPSAISEDRWPVVKKTVMTALTDHVWPAYADLLKFVTEEYYPAAYDVPGISSIPNGKRYYENRTAYFTTLSITPEEVYQKGKEEVARIRAQMAEIIKEVGYEGSFGEFIQFLRTDEQFYAKTPQELLSYASWLSKKAEGQLPRLFSDLYKLPFTVEPVPDDIAPTYTAGRYVRGSRSQDRAGIYWVNTYNLPARSLYNLPALTVHEAVPGHHLQIMLASELKGLPNFRTRFYISAFGEGWGLYSEYLGEEMGMYATPYDRFGRYTYEMWRACRLVVDVGLHYKGWSRQEAVDFLAGNTALSIHEVNTEIDRYIGWPGQALSYKIGEITIKDLRVKAEQTLGAKFDIKEFHKRILRNGSVPLPTLIREIEDWIAEAGN